MMRSHDPRDRITRGLNTARLRIETKRALPAIPALLVGVAMTLVGGALLFSQLTPTLFKSTREVRFAITDAYGILENVDEVRYRGVPAGTIKEIERDGTRLVLRVGVRDDFPVYRNARAELRPETPLNDMYLDIVEPGTPQAGELGGDDIVAESRTDTSIKINDVLNTLRSTERTRLTQLLDNLGNGMKDGGMGLRAAVRSFMPFVANAGKITDALGRRENLTKRLVHNAGVLTEALGERETEIRDLVRNGSATLGTLQEGSADLDATLRELPPTVGSVQSSFRAVSGVLGDVDRAVADLNPVADDLPEALSAVRGLDKALAPAVQRLQKPVRDLVPFAVSLRPFSGDLDATATALSPQLGSIDKVTKSVALCEEAIVHFFQWNASLSKFGDARAPIPRGNLAVGTPDLGVPGATKRRPVENCAGGETIRGTVATEGDQG